MIALIAPACSNRPHSEFGIIGRNAILELNNDLTFLLMRYAGHPPFQRTGMSCSTTSLE
jgi:hypothetical protein